MDNQVILANEDFIQKGIGNSSDIKGKKGLKKNVREIKKGKKVKGGVNKKNGKLEKDEKNFLALLVHHYLKKEVISKGQKSEKVKKMKSDVKKKVEEPKVKVKQENLKGKDIKKTESDEVALKLVKGKGKKVKVEVEKVAVDKIIGEKNVKKTKKKTGSEKEVKELDNIKSKEKVVSKRKLDLEKVKVSKVEEIKISPETREIKFENFKMIKPKSESTQLNRANLVEEVAKIIQNTMPKGNRVFRIHLEPPDLGKIYIQLSFSNDKKMDMKVYVQKPEVQHYLNSGIETLKTNIENLGLKFDLPIIQTLSEFNSGEKGDGNGKEEGNQKKIKFKLYTEGKENPEYNEEYIGVMDYLSGRVDIKA